MKWKDPDPRLEIVPERNLYSASTLCLYMCWAPTHLNLNLEWNSPGGKNLSSISKDITSLCLEQNASVQWTAGIEGHRDLTKSERGEGARVSETPVRIPTLALD